MLRRATVNPILTREDVPAMDGLVDPSSVFNPGAVEHGGRIHLLLRVQARSRATSLVLASSVDGRRFEVDDRPVVLEGLEREQRTLHHVYDPRLTRVGDDVVVVFAADMDDACRLGVARSTAPHDLSRFAFLGFTEWPSRNGVLFPERIEGRWCRLERPNLVTDAGGVATGDAVRLAWSDDLVTWELEDEALFAGRWRYWDELIGPGPPPIRTAAGWLCLYHGVATHFASANIYQAGAVLLDGDDPRRVLGRTWDNLLEPREPYELTGQVPNVVFPSGAVVRGLEPGGVADDGDEVLVYYGAADTCVGLAMGSVGELVGACLAGADRM